MGSDTMRLLIAATLLAAATGAANASSFETLGAQPPKSDTSIIVLGNQNVASVSIETLGVPDPVVIRDEPAVPPLESEAPTPSTEPPQAAVEPQADPQPLFREPLPRVIRGGMEGEAFSNALPDVPVDASVEPARPAAPATAQPQASARPEAPQPAGAPEAAQRPMTPRIVPQ